MTGGSCPDDSEGGNGAKRGGKVEKDARFRWGAMWKDMQNSVLLGPNNMVLEHPYVCKVLCWSLQRVQ